MKKLVCIAIAIAAAFPFTPAAGAETYPPV
jgi:hypothetical protein